MLFLWKNFPDYNGSEPRMTKRFCWYLWRNITITSDGICDPSEEEAERCPPKCKYKK